MAFKPTLSEDPDALKGASEWATKEIERMEKEERDSKEIYERIKPLRQEAFRKIREREQAVVTS